VILDDFLPDANFTERHSRLVHAPRDRVHAALLELRLSDVSWIATLLLAIRSLPARAIRNRRKKRDGKDREHPSSLPTRRERAAPARGNELPLLSAMLDRGFICLANTPEEIVLGAVGEPWKLAAPPLPLRDAREYCELHDASVAKMGFNFALREVNGGTLVTTETRVSVTDAGVRKKFARYWLLVRYGSGLIRVLCLAALARRAECCKEGG
jgi:hypothetical protein